MENSDFTFFFCTSSNWDQNVGFLNIGNVQSSAVTQFFGRCEEPLESS